MGRVVGGVRGRAIRAGLVAGVLVALLLAFGAPASASTVVASGTTECADGNHVIHWSIGNPATLPMTIEYALAASDTAVYTVEDGYDRIVAPGATTAATTIVPPGITGTISLGVQADWPNGVSRFDTADVVLASVCPGPTTTTTTTTIPVTTTTQPETATTQPETATTVPEIPTTVPETPTTAGETPTTEAPTTTEVAGTTVVPGTTTPDVTTTLGGQVVPPPGGTTTTTKPGPPTLPRTGSSTTYLFVFGALFVAGGGGILMHKRNLYVALRGQEAPVDLRAARRDREKKKRALTVYLPPRR